MYGRTRLPAAICTAERRNESVGSATASATSSSSSRSGTACESRRNLAERRSSRSGSSGKSAAEAIGTSSWSASASARSRPDTMPSRCRITPSFSVVPPSWSFSARSRFAGSSLPRSTRISPRRLGKAVPSESKHLKSITSRGQKKRAVTRPRQWPLEPAITLGGRWRTHGVKSSYIPLPFRRRPQKKTGPAGPLERKPRPRLPVSGCGALFHALAVEAQVEALALLLFVHAQADRDVDDLQQDEAAHAAHHERRRHRSELDQEAAVGAADL